MSRLRKRIDRYVTRRLKPQVGGVELVRKKIYIVPSKTGLIFGLLLFILFILAMNYNNSLVFALTFFFAAVYLVSMIHVHRNLQGLIVSALPAADVFCWEDVQFKLKFENPAAIEKNAFQLRLSTSEETNHLVDVPPRGFSIGSIYLDSQERGLLRLPRFSVSTTFPGGLFYAWSWVHLTESCIVYPKPASSAPIPPSSTTDEGASAIQKGLEDISGIREYQQGDSLKRVAWKALAKGQGLKALDTEEPADDHIVLDWDSTYGDVEARLSTLCRWVIDCDVAGQAYGLILPETKLDISKGSNHRINCLRALARFGHE